MAMARLSLPTVTLCAVTSVNVPATIAALEACLGQIDFAETILLTDASVAPGEPIRVEPVSPIRSSRAYSNFLLQNLVNHVRTEHCLVVQWDGFVIDATRWEKRFLEHDYIGAPWPQFSDGHDVGNGGFSLRSRRLLAACRDPDFRSSHPEDLAICRVNRQLLEQRHGIRFADRATAERFSYERTSSVEPSFGFHGIFNMIPALGFERFWEIYATLDERSTAAVDYRLLMSQIRRAGGGWSPRARLTLDRVRRALGW